MKIDYFYHHCYNFNAPLCLNENIYNRRSKWGGGSNIKCLCLGHGVPIRV